MTNSVIKSPVLYGNESALPAPAQTASVRQQTIPNRAENTPSQRTGFMARARVSFSKTSFRHLSGIDKTSNRHRPPEQKHSQTGARGFLP